MTDLEALAIEVAEIRTTVERLERELLGNGQPGRCQRHGEDIATLMRWRTATMAVLSAGGFVIGLLVRWVETEVKNGRVH